MVVELISVGTEILLGNIVNTNAQYLSIQCANLGLSLYYQSVVGDNEERLRDAIKTALLRSDLVILTGGLGPTVDDLTKEVTASTIGKRLICDEHTKERISSYFKQINRETTESIWKQAEVIDGAIVVDNHNGTAPGLIIETEEGKRIILLPGPPNEMVPMFQNDIFPYLNNLTPDIIYSKMIKICGIGESLAENMISDLIENQTNPTIAPYAKTGEVHLRVTAKASTQEEAKELIKPIIKEIKNRFKDNIYTTHEKETLEEVIVKLLIKHNLMVTTAESCTGGLVAGRIVNVSGASSVFNEGFVTYSNKAKRKYLDVKKSTLRQFGAVSEETAREMATGVALNTESDTAIAITGIAGPEGGTEEKPVGLVYIGCYVNKNVVVHKYIFKGNREKVREYSVVSALDLLRRCIIENYEN
ncbi:competence/damage-inducible protein A [Anaeromicropila herbilytica]|uniref:Putative competence-damage inducible protein n=1 Tax=Anaeromicropila herbilytica TaxID=2785025 RepID=A0A7R7EM52_9FIRM|nr:competence/damage-inducible protein A [Anaeromicropila herbilytica]BCN31425.1 CinA-like protein [Anaeromicropila herbilytica]